MNVHSQIDGAWVIFGAMPATDRPSGRETDRRGHILAAAERAFVRQGFHAATMHDVAAEAEMSPGNLYRYFRSKEAIVGGLCARDLAALADDFGGLTRSDDIFGAIERMLRKQLVAEPRQRFQLVVEIWAEATRNPDVAAICLAFDAQVRGGLTAVINSAKRNGVAAPQIDTSFAVRAMFTIGIGLFKRRAHEADFNGEDELGLALGLISAVLRGAARPSEFGPSR
jgi:TetR/AcrR family transcriptional regulator, repressor for uid operon